MNITILLFDLFFILSITFIYCSIKVSSKEAKEEYEKDNY